MVKALLIANLFAACIAHVLTMRTRGEYVRVNHPDVWRRLRFPNGRGRVMSGAEEEQRDQAAASRFWRGILREEFGDLRDVQLNVLRHRLRLLAYEFHHGAVVLIFSSSSTNSSAA
jgi:hypothetical protein